MRVPTLEAARLVVCGSGQKVCPAGCRPRRARRSVTTFASSPIIPSPTREERADATLSSVTQLPPAPRRFGGHPRRRRRDLRDLVLRLAVEHAGWLRACPAGALQPQAARW